MKSRPDLIPGAALLSVGIVLAHGAAKHGEHRPAERPFAEDVAALMRHLAQWQDGAGPDDGTRQSHLAHVAARALLLLGAELAAKRPPEPTPEQLAEVDRRAAELGIAARPIGKLRAAAREIARSGITGQPRMYAFEEWML